MSWHELVELPSSRSFSAVERLKQLFILLMQSSLCYLLQLVQLDVIAGVWQSRAASYLLHSTRAP